MKISTNSFFRFQEASNKIDGYWKATKNGSSFKIDGFLGQDNKIHLILATQTWAQWFFSTLVTVFTFGLVKDYSRDEKKIDCECTVDVEEVKKLIITSYQEMMALSSVVQGVNEVALRLFNRISKNPSKIDSAQVTSVQAFYAEKLKKSTIEIVKNVLTFFMNPRIRAMSPSELKEVLEVAQKDYPVIMEERTQKFFNGMMHSINCMLNDLKGMKESFDHLALISEDPNIRNKLIQPIAFGFIKNLMEEFDQENVSIVDQMIQ